ncbi:PREDICTED: AP2-like ethylene-responsive transcription factor PLT2 [Lupinus angustifolius]|uniref:AP2-like ethylene-responsive transcription factor PLT2 n=1 Tax=Lupinus angustifolius TaxID=3871 RepID=UPI00092E2B3E|nr:PREDICTED: AP2-like ethylene-responsive transcription factor PLT2 [Lupinus angustifolius]
MNSNDWLSFPLSPTHSPLQAHDDLQATQYHQFPLGLVNENMENPFQIHDWHLINTQSNEEVPKVADFLGVSRSENHSDLPAMNEIQPNESEYLLTNAPMQNTSLTTSSNYDYQESANSNLQSLTLSMGSGKDLICETSGDNSTKTVEAAPSRRTLDTFGQRTSIYRGVTRHRWTGRYEAHLWDNSCRREGQSRKGRQVYLGGYDKEEKAARAYDLASLKYWGISTTTNFPISNYEKEIDEMKHMTRQEFVASIRRKSSGFSRGASMYRGVTRHHQHGRWQARIGRVAGNKDLYLGTFSTEEEAAEAYDIAAIKFRGLKAVTNFDMNRYDAKAILESNTLPIGGGGAKRLKEAQALEISRKHDQEMIALGQSFQYGTSSSIRLQPYPLMQQFEQPPQPLLTLQNHDMSHFSQDHSSLHPSYLQTQLHLHQQSGSSYIHQSAQNAPFYNSYLQNHHPALLQGMMNMGSSSSSSSLMENDNNNVGGFTGNVNAVGSSEQLGLVKVDYDMSLGSYGGWSEEGTESMEASTAGGGGGVFNMWNEWQKQ